MYARTFLAKHHKGYAIELVTPGPTTDSPRPRCGASVLAWASSGMSLQRGASPQHTALAVLESPR
jgi:hypothetical protein